MIAILEGEFIGAFSKSFTDKSGNDRQYCRVRIRSYSPDSDASVLVLPITVDCFNTSKLDDKKYSESIMGKNVVLKASLYYGMDRKLTLRVIDFRVSKS